MYKVTKIKAYPYSDNVVEVSEYKVGDQVELRRMNDGRLEISHVYPRRNND